MKPCPQPERQLARAASPEQLADRRLYVMTFLAVLVLAALAPAQTFTVLYNFTDTQDGGTPYRGPNSGRSR
ncbi:MAG TPA: hypothetical protein VN948_01925 [Terriglobales bacterium]|nr:hypothetical protein [Terriglobales bacterium]